MTTILQLNEIKELVDIPQLIEDIEAGFVLYSQGRVQVPPVAFLHFDDPPGDVHIKYGSVIGGEFYVLKMASGFPNNVALGQPVANGVILVFSQTIAETSNAQKVAQVPSGHMDCLSRLIEGQLLDCLATNLGDLAFEISHA